MRSLCSSHEVKSFGLAVVLSAAGSMLLAQSLLAQDPLAQRPAPATAAIPDGGVRETLESIFIPPKPNAPFSLTLDTEWTRAFGNGGTYTLVNERHIARDTAGRIYEERWYLVPKNGKRESTMNYIQIGDPTRHTLYNCQVELKRCYLLTYTGSVAADYQPPVRASGPLPEGNGFHTHEDLGTNSLDGFDTSGYRETTTLNAGVFGNDQPMVTTREFWYAPQLGINLLSKVDSPQAGKQTFTVTEISSAEPDPQLFTIPAGFEVVDQRKTQPPQ
jgi:hypothetical protein